LDVYVENLQWEQDELTKEQQEIERQMQERSEIDTNRCTQ